MGSEFSINTDAGNQMGWAIFSGGKYLVIVDNGSFSGGTTTGGDVYGQFITP